jgi:hypothetical protein
VSQEKIYIGEILGNSLPMIIFLLQARIQRSVSWITAFAGMTDRVHGTLD